MLRRAYVLAKINDVAERAGVSIKTVSRVINDDVSVKQRNRERVLDAIKELGYVPSSSARALRSHRSYQITFAVDASRNVFANVVLFGALRACHQLGYELIVEMVDEGRQAAEDFPEEWISSLTRKGKPEGVILFPPLSTDQHLVEKLFDADIPSVSVGSRGVNDLQGSVTVDDKLAAYEMTCHLIEKGHARIGFVHGAPNQLSSRDRFEGYKIALAENGLQLDEGLCFQGDFFLKSGVSAGSALLDRKDRPTAIFASNDLMAAGVLVAAQKLGISVPSELSLAGFDDDAIAQGTWPNLTTIRQPMEALGEAAVKLLSSAKGKIDAKSSNAMTIGHELIERESVKAI